MMTIAEKQALCAKTVERIWILALAGSQLTLDIAATIAALAMTSANRF